MNYQVTLEQLAAERGLTLTPLSELSRIGTPRKISCCGGWVLYTYAESAVDSSVVLRDASGSIVCAFHQSMLSLHPDVLTSHALVLLQDVSFIPSINRKFPSFLVVDICNLIAFMLPEEDNESARPEHNGGPSHAHPVSTSVTENGSSNLVEYDAVKEGDPDSVASSHCYGSPSQQQHQTQDLAPSPPPQGQQQYSLQYGLDPSQKESLAEQGYDNVFPVEIGHRSREGECCGTFPHLELGYESQNSEREVNDGFSLKARQIRGPLISSSSPYALPSRGVPQSFPSSLNNGESPQSMFGAVSNSIPNPVTPLSDVVEARRGDHSNISPGLPEEVTGREQSSQQIMISQVHENERPIHSAEEVVEDGDDSDKINAMEEEETEEEQEEEEDAIDCLEFAD